MNVMLVNPSSKNILRNGGDRPPLGILYIGSVLKENGHQVRIRDMDHLSLDDLCNEIDLSPPDYMGISVYTSPVYKEAVSLAETFKGQFPLIAGGYHATAMPDSLKSKFSSVVIGEGESAILDIINNKKTGLIYGKKEDISKIPQPARELINLDRYTFKQDGRKAATMMTSRGCPNNCVFCGNMNRQVRFSPIDHVLKEIHELKGLGYNDFYFYDDNFITSKRRTMELLSEIVKEKIHFRITTRAETIDDHIAHNLSLAGCSWVSLGIESGSDERLYDIGKNMYSKDNLKAVQILRHHGIKTKGFFMFGLPNESMDDAEKTIAFSKYLKEEGLTSADFYIMTPFPGTPIWDNPEKHGIKILDRDYTKYLEAGKTPPKAFHRTKYMSAKQIEDIRNYAESEWNRFGNEKGVTEE